MHRVEFDRVDLVDDELAIVVLHRGAALTPLRVCVGPRAAALVSIAATWRRSSRPLTHDLLQEVMHSFGLELEWVVIAEGEEDLFLAELVVSGRGEWAPFDSRPADAIAFALREGAPIFVTDDAAKRSSK